MQRGTLLVKADRASSTAHLIARSLVLLSHDSRFASLVLPDSVMVSEWCMEACSAATPRVLRLLRQRWFRALAYDVERALLPGMMLHYAVRKRRIEELTCSALAAGVTQVIILGAGFDSLATRLSGEYPVVQFLELDHPATQAVKRRALKRHGALPAAAGNLELVPQDLVGSNVQQALSECRSYDPTRRTLLVAEGLLMYLPQADVERALGVARNHPDGECLFTFMEPQSDGRIRFGNQHPLIDAWLARRGEPFRWGLRREEMPGFLRGVGLECREIDTPEFYRKQYLRPLGQERTALPEGDYLCHAASSSPATTPLALG